MNPCALFEQRQKRICAAVALEKCDRTPVILEYAGFAARATGTPMGIFLSSLSISVRTMIQAFHLVGDADGIDYGSYSPYSLCDLWMSKVAVPGVDLPEDATCQVCEAELMKREDYRRILDEGWPDFFRNFLDERVLKDVPAHLLPANQPAVDVRSEWASHGIPVLAQGTVTIPFECLCGARSLTKFFCDLIRVPDEVQRVMDAMVPHLTDAACRQAKASGFPGIWVGGWRSASEMISPREWNRFVWPYLERVVWEVVGHDLIAVLHLDSNWTRDLAFLRSLPGKRCILSTDGKTDLLRAKEVLGDTMCLMGDVPASMLAYSASEDVYEYCRNLIRALGPTGFILHSGCDIPENAKPENVRIMVHAAQDHS